VYIAQLWHNSGTDSDSLIFVVRFHRFVLITIHASL